MIEVENKNGYELIKGMLDGLATRPYELKMYNDGTFFFRANVPVSGISSIYSSSIGMYVYTLSATLPEAIAGITPQNSTIVGSVASGGVMFFTPAYITNGLLSGFVSATYQFSGYIDTAIEISGTL